MVCVDFVAVDGYRKLQQSVFANTARRNLCVDVFEAVESSVAVRGRTTPPYQKRGRLPPPHRRRAGRVGQPQ